MCHWAQWVFAALYLAALGLFAVGTFGLFGQPRDPLGGVFLLPLGIPWNLIPVPEAALVWLGCFAPAVNLIGLHLFCRWRGR